MISEVSPRLGRSRARGKWTRRLLAGGIAILMIAGGVWQFGRTRATPRQLNVVLVTLDTTRADRVGCYGHRLALTPALDAIAKAGALFEFARTPYPLTLPAHASVLTGLNPPEHGLQVIGRGRLSEEIPVLAELLRTANYETGAFIGAYVLNSKFGLDRGFETYDDDLAASVPQRLWADRQRDGRFVLDAALRWLAPLAERPFFCWIHLYDPHAPYLARENIFGDSFVDRPYDAGIAYADLQFARLRDFLAERGLMRRTLVVVVGDHGEGLLEHNEPDHGYQVYDSTLRVPLIFAGPSDIKPGIRVTTPVSLIDVMSTILDCLQVPIPKHVSGRSLSPALSGGSIPVTPCYSETELAFLESRCAPLRSVTTERWKFIETTSPELYDLAADPNEVRNLAGTEQVRVEEFRNLLGRIRDDMAPRSAASVNLTENEKRILASLGYAAGTGSSRAPAPGERLRDVKEMLPHYVRLADARERAERGDPVGAMQVIRQILRDAPDYSTAQLLLGDLLVRQKQFALAAHEYAGVASARPDNAEAHSSWANALAALGQFEDAAEHYRQALEIDPAAAPTHYYFAITLIRLGKPAEALLELEESLHWNPALVDARLRLGKLLAESGRTREAVQQYKQALRYRPDLPPPSWMSNPNVRKQP